MTEKWTPLSPEEFAKLCGTPSKKTAAPTRASKAASDAPKSDISAVVAAAREQGKREAEAAAHDRRRGLLKWLAVILAGTTLWGWLGRDNDGTPGKGRRSSLRSFFASQQEPEDFYEEPPVPVYHPTAGAVTFEVPLPGEHPVSSSVKTDIHRAQAGTRDLVRDTTATVGAIGDLGYAAADMLDAIGSAENSKNRTKAERARLKSRKKIDRARAERAEASVERARISNEQARLNMKLKLQREKQREADRLQRIKETERKRLEQERNAQRRAAEKAAAAKRRQAEALRKKTK